MSLQLLVILGPDMGKTFSLNDKTVLLIGQGDEDS
jgi:hypothetical protein